jgi:hypothetical protein
MGVRSGLQIKAKAIAPGFAGIFGSLLVEDSLILGTESVGAAGALSTTVPVSLVTSAGADQAQTLGDGSSVGQIKILYAVSTANSWKCTPDNTDGEWAKITFTTIGENAILIWSGNGWSVLSRGGGGNANGTTTALTGIVA